MIQFLNKWTGEVHELPDSTAEEIKDAWLALSETIKACERAKDKLKPKVLKLINPNGLLEVDGYVFRHSHVQRMNYDKTVMRQVLDEDTLDLFLIPDKTAIDKWLKETVASNDTAYADATSQLRNTMLPSGKPYTTLKLEKITHE